MIILLLVIYINRILGIDDYWFSLGDSLVLIVMGKIVFMLVLVLVVRFCLLGVEVIVFVLLMLIYNLVVLIFYEGGVLLMYWLKVIEINFDNLWLLIVIINLFILLLLFLLNWLFIVNV